MNESGNEIKNYYKELKENLSDYRDNRGKRHVFAFVVFSFLLAILRSSSKLNYSIIHRIMQRDHEFLINEVGEASVHAISYSQFKRVLAHIDYESFNSINQIYFNKQVECKGLFWRAIDGKELRGTIDKVAGEKRSENIIQQVSHQDRSSQLIGFYNGSKESEKTLVQKHFEKEKDLNGYAYSFDALHTYASLLADIALKRGVYLAQVKENQKILLEDCKHIHNHLKEKQYINESEKGHGRIETRQGFLYLLNVECLAPRWKNSDIQTLLVVQRNRFIAKTKIETTETAYFVSNKKLTKESGLELFNAARQHWRIEADNNIRDVNFGEDEIRSFNKNTSRVMAVSLSIVLNLLRRINNKNNIRILRENLNADRNLIYHCLTAN